MPTSNRLRASIASLEWSPVSLLFAALVVVQLTVLYGTIGGEPNDIALSLAALYVSVMFFIGSLAGIGQSNLFLFALFAGWSVFAWLAYVFDPFTLGALMGTFTAVYTLYYAFKYRHDGEFSLVAIVR